MQFNASTFTFDFTFLILSSYENKGNLYVFAGKQEKISFV